jgi:predicted ATPase
LTLIRSVVFKNRLFHLGWIKMIEIMQGTLGSGKSAVATARALEHIQAGGVVAANFSLVDGWSDVLARQNPWAKWFDDELRFKRSESYYKRFFRVDSLKAINQLNPKDIAVRKHRTTGKFQEGQGLLILDECQLVFNARKWDKNFNWITFMTQTRKLGWNVLLIAHTIEMIDSQIRPLAEYESRFRNLQKVKFPIFGFPLAPFPLFVVIKRYAGLGAGSSVVVDRQVYPLPLWAAQLYDSLEVFSQEKWGTVTNPRLCGSPPTPPPGGGVVKPKERIRTSSLIGSYWDAHLKHSSVATV